MRDVPQTRLLPILAADPHVRLVYAYGSTVAGGMGPRSDVDVAVLLDHDPSPDELRELHARLLAIEPRTDLVLLNGAPPLLRHEVVTSGVCLLARDPTEQGEFELDSLARFLDFQPFRRLQQEYLRERVEERRGPSGRRAT